MASEPDYCKAMVAREEDLERMMAIEFPKYRDKVVAAREEIHKIRASLKEMSLKTI